VKDRSSKSSQFTCLMRSDLRAYSEDSLSLNMLTSACNVPGGDATIRHDRVKHALNDLMLVSKLKTKVEDVKFHAEVIEHGKCGTVCDLLQ
jgi:hypothetical protein